MVTIVAHYTARPGAGDGVARILAKHVAATRAEGGCLQFDACRSCDDGDRFLLYEKYVNEDTFQSHRRSVHFLEYIEREIAPLLVTRTWQRYEEVIPAQKSC